MFPEGRLIDFAIVGALALMVVGPKDLPILMRKVGQFIARMRGMAAEFRASFDELARQSELDELRKEVEALRNAQPMKVAADATGLGDLHETFDDINASLRTGDISFNPAMAYQPESAVPAAEAAASVEAPPPEPPKPPKPRAPRKPRKKDPIVQ